MHLWFISLIKVLKASLATLIYQRSDWPKKKRTNKDRAERIKLKTNRIMKFQIVQIISFLDCIYLLNEFHLFIEFTSLYMYKGVK